LQDVTSTFGTDERFGIGDVESDVVIDGGNQFRDAGKYPPRRSRSVVMPQKKRSTIFSQEAEVGVKCVS